MTTPLTPAVRIQTKAAFPVVQKDEKTGSVAFLPSQNEKITIQSSAELMQYNVPGSKYQSSFNFVLLHDADGQPMLLSIGTDKRLYICVHVNAGAGSWETFDITPASQFEASVCDASNSPDNRKALIAVSGRSTDKTKTIVYHVAFDNPRLMVNSEGLTVGSPFGALSWIDSSKTIEVRDIKSLVCEYFGGQTQYQIVAGVAATKLEGSHYIYSPSVKQEWQLVKFPVQVENIRSVVPANFPALGPGYVVLFEDNTAGKAVSCLFRGDGVSKLVYLTGLQNPRKLSVCINRRGQTDVIIAADNGIGYVDTRKLTEGPLILLNDIGCSNAVATEFAVSSEESNVTIHAVSLHGELFVVRGVRNAASANKTVFPVSALPIPIRNDIRNITGKFNPLTKSYEIVYVSKDNDSLRHLIRDPETGLWKELDLVARSQKANKTTRTPAFLMTITLSNGKGVVAPGGYNIQLSSAPTVAYINDRCYNLTRRPQTIPVNAFGQLQIAIPTTEHLTSEPLAIGFMADANDDEIYQVQPAQRVLHNLAQLNTGSALKNAKTYDGRSLFSDKNKTKDEENFNQAADLFSRLPEMLAKVGSDGHRIDNSTDNQEITVSWQKDENGSSPTNSNWLSNAVDAVGEALGDVIEFIKSATKSLVKIALKIAGPLIRLIIKIGAKIIRFVLNTVSAIATGILSFLEGVFDIDLSWLKDWFTFRFQKVEATQKELAALINNGLILTSRYLRRNQGLLGQSLDALGTIIEGYVTRPYTQEQMHADSSGAIGILDNPIVSALTKFNPISWILEAIAEEFGQDFKIPSLNLNIGAKVLAALKQQLSLLVGFLQRSWHSFTAAIGQPQTVMQNLLDVFRDGFWTLFESIKTIILALFTLLLESFESIADFCRTPWEIPDLTDLWKDITDIDFSVINFISYVGAQMLELLNFGGKPVFDGYKISEIFSDVDNKVIPGLLPKGIQDDLESYEQGSLSFQQELQASAAAQSKGAAFMKANPVKEPRFGLMATTSDLTTGQGNLQKLEPPSVGARAVLALARSGRSFARTANIGIEGLMKPSGIGQQDQSAIDSGKNVRGGLGSGQPGSSMSSSSFQPASKLSFDDSAMNISSASTSAGDGMSLSTSNNSKSLSSGTGFKTLIVGSNSLALGCKVTELFVLLNYYDEAGQQGENLTGSIIDAFATLISLVLSVVGDSQPILAVSNIIANAGCFTSACLAPEKNFPEISTMVGTASGMLASGLFLVPSPPTQGVAWAGFGIDVVNSLGLCGWLCANISRVRDYSSFTGGPKGEKPINPKPDTKDKPKEKEPDPALSDEEPDEEEKKKRRLVDRDSEIRAGGLIESYQGLEHQQTQALGEFVLGDLVNNAIQALQHIRRGEEWFSYGWTPIQVVYETHKARMTGQAHVPNSDVLLESKFGQRVDRGELVVNNVVVTRAKFDAFLADVRLWMELIFGSIRETKTYIRHHWDEAVIA